MLRADLHCHIGHAHILDMVNAASASGIDTLGVAEHIFQLAEVRNLYPGFDFPGGTVYTLHEYRSAIGEAYEAGMNILMGFELDFTPGYIEKCLALLGECHPDYIIGALHGVQGVSFKNLKPFTQSECDRLWSVYLEDQAMWAETSCCNILGHPLRLNHYVKGLPADIRLRLESLVRRCKQVRVCIEINSLDYFVAPDLSEQLIGLCAENGAKVLIGSDAHLPGHIGSLFSDIEVLLRRYGIDSHTVFIEKRPHQEKIEDFPPAAARFGAAAYF